MKSESSPETEIKKNNLEYLFSSDREESEEFSADPLEDLLNEFGTEDPAVIEREKEVFETIEKARLGNKQVALEKERKCLAPKQNLEDMILEVQMLVKELKYYNSSILPRTS